jgi:hypothetical protein
MFAAVRETIGRLLSQGKRMEIGARSHAVISARRITYGQGAQAGPGLVGRLVSGGHVWGRELRVLSQEQHARRGSDAMNSDWQDGELVLHVRVSDDSGRADRLFLRPLGVAVAGPGPEVMVPGAGRTALRDIGSDGVTVDFGQIEISGPRARHIANELARSQPDVERGYGAGAEGIVVMDVAPQMRDDLLNVFRDHTYVRASSLLTDLRGILESPNGPALRVAVCDQHNVPEICPFQH